MSLEDAIKNVQDCNKHKYFVWFEAVYVYAENPEEAEKLAIEKIKQNPVVDDIQNYDDKGVEQVNERM